MMMWAYFDRAPVARCWGRKVLLFCVSPWPPWSRRRGMRKSISYNRMGNGKGAFTHSTRDLFLPFPSDFQRKTRIALPPLDFFAGGCSVINIRHPLSAIVRPFFFFSSVAGEREKKQLSKIPLYPLLRLYKSTIFLSVGIEDYSV